MSKKKDKSDVPAPIDSIQINGVELIIDSYRIPGTFRPLLVKIQRTEGRDYDGVRWAIIQGDYECMNKKGEWEYQPMPSSRTKAFYKRCRFDTVEEAVDVWIKSRKTEAITNTKEVRVKHEL